MPSGELTVLTKKCDVEWKVNFASFSEEDDALYYSPDFTFEGESWYLAIKPNGSKSLNSSGYIDLRVWRNNLDGSPILVETSFSLKNVNGKKDYRKQNTECFDNVWCCDFDRFLSRSDFEKRQSEFLSSGFLTIVCTLKRLSSTGSASNIVTADCSYCKHTFDAEEISFHEKKCRIICPDCSEIILLQNWDEHECQLSRAEATNNATETFVVHHHDKILQDFKQIFLKQENCDVVLKVKGRDFPAHKVILAARSSVFESTFRNNMKEKETGVVDIEDCDPSIFPDFLCFLYSDDVDNLSKENVFGLFTAADKYNVPDLRRKCLEFLKENLSVETFSDTLTLALLHSETELIHLSTEFFIKNAKQILINIKWQLFAAENPTQSNELFIKYVESVEGTNA